jgi:hypothetical protein
MPVAPGDPRAADLVLEGAEEILHVEAERAIVDLQAQLRPAQVKRGILAARYEPVRLIIALPDTRRIRAILRATLHSWPGASRCRLASYGGPFGKESHLEAMEFFS